MNWLFHRELFRILFHDFYHFLTFTDNQRKNGALVIHLLAAIYFFTLLAVVCSDYFLPSVECVCEDLNIPKVFSVLIEASTLSQQNVIIYMVIKLLILRMWLQQPSWHWRQWHRKF